VYRVDHSTRVVDGIASGKDGYGEGNPGISPATILTAEVANSLQEELCNTIEGAGLTLDKTNRAQLAKAALNLAHSYTVTGSSIGSGGAFSLTSDQGDAGFSLASNAITVPTKGLYLVSFSGYVARNNVSDPTQVTISLKSASFQTFTLAAQRFNATSTDKVHLSASVLFKIDDLAEVITVENGSPDQESISNGYLSIVRLHAI